MRGLNYFFLVLRNLFVICLLFFTPLVAAEDRPLAPPDIPGVTIISAEEVVEMLLNRPGIVLIDSRKNTEYLKGHIEGAVNLLNTEMQPADLARAVGGKDQTIVFYCNGERCLRSSDAASKAIAWGYKNIFWFRGGWKEWTDKRLPVATDDKK